MMRIGVLSDTHGFLDEKIFNYFEHCDEIWHAGDIGNLEIIDRLNSFKPSRIVHGNIDDHIVRRIAPETLSFEAGTKKVILTHIAGSFGKYHKALIKSIEEFNPDLLVCGHSHLLKIKYDSKFNLLYLNPGASGKSGFHQQRTIVRFNISIAGIKDMEVIELNPRYPD